MGGVAVGKIPGYLISLPLKTLSRLIRKQ